jgi:hypothetical protein
MDLFDQLRTTIEEADSREEAVDLLVERMGMTPFQANDVLSAPFTPELRTAMYPHLFGPDGLFA